MSKPVVPNLRRIFRSVRTVVGIENQVRRELGLPFSVRPNSTLNQKLSILPTTTPPNTLIPTIGYFCIGCGGVERYAGGTAASASWFPKLYQHRSTMTGLFKMIPFAMREINNDLTPVQRQKYALRRLEEINGVKYYVYYLKRLNLSDVRLTTKIITQTAPGEFSEIEYAPTTADINPIAKELSVDEENILKAQYARSVANVTVELDQDDIMELFNVFNIREGDPMLAAITEIGLVSGVDRAVEITTSSGRAQFTEVLAAQIAHINQCLHYMASDNGGIRSVFNLGVNEPIYIQDDPVKGGGG